MMPGLRGLLIGLAITSSLACPLSTASAQDAGLAQQLANPVASLISLPMQFNYDSGYGPRNAGEQYSLRLQPVVPFSVSEDWKVISRTILPIIWQQDIVPRRGEQFGLGDTQQSFFLSPKRQSADEVLWGAGPVFLLPTVSEDLLSTEKWAAGPTAVMLRQTGPWTYGVLANHLWSFAGDSGRRDVNLSFVQPFVAYTTRDTWTFALNTESSYDWITETRAVPVNAIVSKLVRIGGQPVSLGVGLRYWADSPPNGPDGIGLRLIMTFLFPS